MFRREFFAYTYYDALSGLTIKNVFFQKYQDECEACQESVDQALTIKLCLDEACQTSLVNSTLRIKTPVYVLASLTDPFILYNQSVQDISILANGIDVTNETVVDLNDGTNLAKIVTSVLPRWVSL